MYKSNGLTNVNPIRPDRCSGFDCYKQKESPFRGLLFVI